ncbi:hypothetical protein BH11ACT8_BH11ACT8_29130 [soil metagenome]
MHDRSALGPADVDEATLTGIVAELLGHPVASVEVLSSEAVPVAYDLEAITTAGRHWVTGSARTPTGVTAYRIFVKHVQAWTRSPAFAWVPVEMRELAAAGVPWRTEHLAYRSDLGERLPDGLTMPRAVGVFEPDAESAVVWLEDVSRPAVLWTLPRYERAAHLLGRLAASARVAERADVGEFHFTVHGYVHGRLAGQVVPQLMDDGVRRHPVVAAAFDATLRDQLRDAARHATTVADELVAFPMTTSHGDASPNNLLPGPTPDSFVLIDYGFFGTQPVGFDLGQLLVGEPQLGRGSVADVAERDAACVAAYTQGLAAEGTTVAEDDVRRAHALHLLLFSGLSSLPTEHLAQPLSEELVRVARMRAALATYILDLVDATAGSV